MEHVPESIQRADILTKSLSRTRFKEMKMLIGVQDVREDEVKLKEENVDVNLELD